LPSTRVAVVERDCWNTPCSDQFSLVRHSEPTKRNSLTLQHLFTPHVDSSQRPLSFDAEQRIACYFRQTIRVET
jgi:hypothetical protein